MIVVKRKQRKKLLLSGGTDRVIAAMPVPPGGMLMGCTGVYHIVPTGSKALTKVYLVPVRGYAFDMLEFSDITDNNEDQIWDMLTPKDDDVDVSEGSLDIDTSLDATETAPFEEPGEPDANKLFGLRDPYTVFYDIEHTISFASSPHGYADLATDQYYPTAIGQVTWKGGRWFPTGGIAMVGAALPAMDDVTTTVPDGISTIAKMLAYQHLDTAMEMAKPWLLGLSELGAETPWIEFAQLLEELTEPTVYEETAGEFNSDSLQITANFRWQVGVAESPKQKVLEG